MGQPKAWLPIAGETMLGRVVRLVAEVVSPIVVVAAPGQDVPALPLDVEIVRDPQRGRGPLQGLAVGLSALQGKADAAYVSSCDVPFLQPAFIRRMIELLGDHVICVPDVDGFRHPLAGVYRVEVASVANDLIAEARWRPVFLFERVATRLVRKKELVDVDTAMHTLRNLNTPEEYEQARQEIG
jgi:molybdopterin-guanine dinucleotide biosynthesis protein A